MMSKISFGLLLLSFTLGCSQAPKTETVTAPVAAAPAVAPSAIEMMKAKRSLAGVDKKKISKVSTAQIELAKKLEQACIDKSVMKLSKREVKAVCGCIVRNHGDSTESEYRSLLRAYKAGKKNVKPVGTDESLLWDYDMELAEKCVDNAAYDDFVEDTEANSAE